MSFGKLLVLVLGLAVVAFVVRTALTGTMGRDTAEHSAPRRQLDTVREKAKDLEKQQQKAADDIARRVGDRVVRDQRALHLGGAQPVPADVDHVVDAAGDPVIAVLVTAAAVAGEVLAGEGAEVRLAEPIGIAEDAAHDPRPRTGDAE